VKFVSNRTITTDVGAYQQTELSFVSPKGNPGSVPVTFTAAGDSVNVAQFVFTYTAIATPTVTRLYPEELPSSGGSVIMEVTDIPWILAAGVSDDVVAMIGSAPASSVKVLSSMSDMARFEIGIPLVVGTGQLDVNLYLKCDGPAKAFFHTLSYYDSSVMNFISVQPSTGSSSGNELIRIKYGQYLTPHTTDEYTAMVLNTATNSESAATVLTSSYAANTEVTTITARTPAASALGLSTGQVQVTLTVGTRSIVFPYNYIADNSPAVKSEPSPNTAPLGGGTKVQMVVKNMGTLADLQIVFGTVPNTAIAILDSVTCGTTECLIKFTAPVCTMSCNTAAQIISTGNAPLAFTFTFFKECDFTSFCAKSVGSSGSAMIPYAAAIANNPPTSSICSMLYCMEPIVYDPEVITEGASSGPVSGGTSIVLSLIDFPPTITATSLPTFKFGVNADVTATQVELLSSPGGGSAAVRVTVPACDSSHVCIDDEGETQLVVQQADESGTVWSASGEFSYEPVAVGIPVLDMMVPNEGLKTTSVQVFARFSNFPYVNETAPWSEVALLFGSGLATTTVTISSLRLMKSSTAAPVAEVEFTVPFGNVNLEAANAQPCLVTLRITQGTTVTTMTTGYSYLGSLSAEFLFASPVYGPAEGGTTIKMRVINLGTTNPNGVTVQFDGTPVNLLAGSIVEIAGSTPVESEISVVSPVRAAGEVQVTMIMPGGVYGYYQFEFRSSSVPIIFMIKYADATGKQITNPVVTEQSDVTIQIVIQNWALNPVPSSIRHSLCASSGGFANKVTTATMWTQLSSTLVSASFKMSDYGTVACPAGNAIWKLEEYNVNSGVWSTTMTTSTADSPVFVNPAPELSGFRGTTIGGQQLALVLYGFPMINSAADVNITWPSSGAYTAAPTMTLVSSTAGAYSTLQITTPPRAAGAIVLTVAPMASPGSAQLIGTFTYVQSPTTVLPKAGSIPSGAYNEETLVTVELQNFAATGNDGMSSIILTDLEISSENLVVSPVKLLRSSAATGTIKFELRMPTRTTAGTVTVSVANRHFVSDGAATFLFRYTEPTPSVISMQPETGSTSGGTVLTAEIKNLNVVTLAESLTMKVTTPTGIVYGTITNILWSDSQSTGITATTPIVTSPGEVTVEVSSADQSVTQTFKYMDTSMSVYSPTTVARGIVTGGQSFITVIKNFPLVDQGGVIARFRDGMNWEGYGTITNVVSNATYTTLHISCPAYTRTGYDIPYTGVTVSVDIYPSSDMSQQVSLPAGFNYVPELSVSEVRFNAEYSAINILLNQNAKLSLLGASFPCSDIMSSAVVSSLGVGTCNAFGSTGTLIRANIIPSSTCASLGTAVPLTAGSITASNGIGTLVTSNPAPSLLDNEAPYDPVAVMIGPSSVGPCDSLTLDGTGSTGTGLTYRWGALDNTALNTLLVSYTTSVLTLPSSALTTVGTTYKITLTVTDCLGRPSAAMVKSVYKSSLPVPSITILGPETRTVQTTEALTLKGDAEFSGCAGKQTLLFRWTLISVPTAAFTASGSSLRVEPGALAGGSSYTFQLEGYPEESPTSVGLAQVVVTCALPALTASIRGGSMTSYSSINVTIDGSRSNDPAGLPISYSWSCEKILSEASRSSCRTASGAALSMPATSVLKVIGGYLSAGTYEFSLAVSGTSGRTASTTTSLELTNTPVLTMSIAPLAAMGYSTEEGTAASGYEQVKYNLKVNPAQKLVLIASVVAGGTNELSRTTTWTETRYGLDVSTSSGRQASGDTTLVLSGDTLLQGELYTFRASSSEGVVTGSTTYNVLVNTPPSGGSCTVTPTTGSTSTTEFSVFCSGYSDDSGDNPSYAFGFTKAGVFTAFESRTDSNKASFVHGTAETLVVEVRVYDLMEAYVSTTTTVTVTDSLSGVSDKEGALTGIVNGALGDQIAKGNTGRSMNLIDSLAKSADTVTSSGGRRLLSVSAAATSLKADLITKLVDVSTSSPAFTDQDVQMKASPLQSLTASASSYSTSTLIEATTMLDGLADGRKGKSVSLELARTMISVSGNVLPATSSRDSTSVNTISAQIERVNRRAAKGVVMQHSPGEAKVDLSSSSDNELFAQRVTRTALIAAPFTTPENGIGKANFTLPASVTSLLGSCQGAIATDDGGASDSVDTRITSNTQTWPSSLVVKSRMYGISLSLGCSDDDVSVQNLPANDPLSISMSVTDTPGVSECRYWTGSEYSMVGMSESSNSPGDASGVVECHSTHATDFIVSEGFVPCPYGGSPSTLCSGNGICNTTLGACTCDSAYQGSDCSIKRACPFDASAAPCTDSVDCPWSSIDYNNPSVTFSVESPCLLNKVRPYCSNNYWNATGCSQYKAICPSNQSDTQCSNRGSCDALTGACSCNQKDAYRTFIAADCSLTSCPGNCTGHGSCDYESGMCTCNRGWVGDACAQLISTSSENIIFNIADTPSQICSLDTFKATVSIAQTPGGLATQFVYSLKNVGTNAMIMNNVAVTHSATWSLSVGSTLPVGNYILDIFATDPLDRGSHYDESKSWSFAVTSNAIVPVAITSGDLSVERSNPLDIRGGLYASQCAGTQTIVWAWSLTDTTTSVDIIATDDAIVKNTKFLSIAADYLTPGHSYTATLTAYYTGLQGSTQATATVTITAIYAPIALAIQQGDVGIGRAQALTVTALPTDRDGIGDGRTLSYSWSIVSASSVGTDLISLASAPTNAASLTVAANSFTAETVYYVNCTVSKANVSSVTTTSVITVSTADVPTVSITPAAEYRSTKVKLDPSTQLSFSTTSTHALPIGYREWTSIPAIDWASATSGTSTSQTTSDLILLPNSLTPGITYVLTFSARINNNGGTPSGTNSISIRINQAPHGGTLDANPSSGFIESTVTPVTLSASNWVADEPVLFRFGYYMPGSASVDPFVLQPYATEKLLSTTNLPVGVVRPILFIKDKHGSVTKVKYGCHDYQVGGVYSTYSECPNVQDILIRKITPSVGESMEDAATRLISAFSIVNNGAAAAVAFAKSVAESLNSVSMTTTTTASVSTRTNILGLVTSALATGQAVEDDQVLGVVAAIGAQPKAVQDTTLLTSLSNSLNSALVSIDTAGTGVDTGVAQTVMNGISRIVAASHNVSAANTNGLSTSTQYSVLTKLHLLTVVSGAADVAFTTVDVDGTTPLVQTVMYKGTKSSLVSKIMSITTARVELPAGDFLAGATGGRRLLSASTIYQMTMVYFSPAANPYLEPPTLASGVVRVNFATEAGAPLAITGLADADAVLVGVHVTVTTHSPICVFRDGSTWSSTGVTTLSSAKAPLTATIMSSAAGDLLYCKTTHIGATTADFAIMESCSASTTCSGHGICNHDGSCHCTCGYYGTACTQFHLATWDSSSKSRYVSDAPGRLSIGNDASGGLIALIPQDGPAGLSSCAGAASAAIGGYSTGVGARLSVTWDVTDSTSYAFLPLSSLGKTPLAAGKYTMCFCNAEKRMDSVYSNCNMDCAFHTVNDTVNIISMPRIGPTNDAGPGRTVRAVEASFRLRAGNSSDDNIKTTDHLFLNTACSLGPAGVASATSTPSFTLSSVNPTDSSVTFSLPNTLHTGDTVATTLKVCFAPIEMGANPITYDYIELIDTMTVIPMPLFNGGTAGRMLTGSSPDFKVTGADGGTGLYLVDGGDKIFFASDCTSVGTASGSSSEPLSIVEYDNAIIGPLCTGITALAVPTPVYSSPDSSEECGGLTSAELNTPKAWCSVTAARTLEDLASRPDDYAAALFNNTGTYLEVDTGSMQIIGAVSTQGKADELFWVTKYTVATSPDGVTWTDSRVNGILHVYHANFDQNTVVTNDVLGTVLARYVRVYPKSWYGRIAMRLGVSVCHTGHKIALPTSPTLTTAGILKACFATRRSEGDVIADYIELSTTLEVVPEAQTAPITVQRSEITGLSFAADGVAKIGDIVVIQMGGCENLLTTKDTFPAGPSRFMTIESGGLIGLQAVLNARLNELSEGSYALCLATSESHGDHASDFHNLLGNFIVQNIKVIPTMSVPFTLPLGTELYIHWTSGSGRPAHGQDWIGIYEVGTCPQLQLHGEEDPFPPDIDTTAPLTQNQCKITSASLEAGALSGTLRFSTAEYGKEIRKLEARFFQGDSRDGQGVVCRRLQGSASELYKYCGLEHIAISDPIQVVATIADGTYEHGHSGKTADRIAGLDMFIDKDTWQMG